MPVPLRFFYLLRYNQRQSHDVRTTRALQTHNRGQRRYGDNTMTKRRRYENKSPKPTPKPVDRPPTTHNPIRRSLRVLRSAQTGRYEAHCARLAPCALAPGGGTRQSLDVSHATHRLDNTRRTQSQYSSIAIGRRGQVSKHHRRLVGAAVRCAPKNRRNPSIIPPSADPPKNVGRTLLPHHPLLASRRRSLLGGRRRASGALGAGAPF